MKIDRLETHDRLEHFKKQEFDIAETCQHIMDQKVFGDVPYYIFAHQRTIGLDERISMFNIDQQDALVNHACIRQFKDLRDVPTHRLIWQPRLTKPKAQDNSMLFRVLGAETLEVVWIIPDKSLWANYFGDQMTSQGTIAESIMDFIHDKGKLEARHPEDLNDERIDRIYTEMSKEYRYERV